MGRSYLFECPKCGYKTQAAGGADRGFTFAVQTILCRDCKTLHDAVVRLKVPEEPKLAAGFSRFGFRKIPPSPDAPPTFAVAVNRLPLPGSRRFRWVSFKPRCPVSLAHRVQPWHDPGHCPRCGNFLEKNALPFRIWE